MGEPNTLFPAHNPPQKRLKLSNAFLPLFLPELGQMKKRVCADLSEVRNRIFLIGSQGEPQGLVGDGFASTTLPNELIAEQQLLSQDNRASGFLDQHQPKSANFSMLRSFFSHDELTTDDHSMNINKIEEIRCCTHRNHRRDFMRPTGHRSW